MLDQTFGTELECYMPVNMTHGQLAAALVAAGINTVSEHYNHDTRTHWKIVPDGSLGDYRRGAEVVSPILRGEDGLRQLRKVCETLTAIGCTVNRSCGLHVHVGARDRDLDFWKRLLLSYDHFEAAIDAFLPPSRRQNRYCLSMRNEISMRRVQEATSIDGLMRMFRTRYLKLNPTSFMAHGTVEFRHHSGTVDADKAVNWVLFCLAMTDRAANPARSMAGPETAIYRGRRVTPEARPLCWRLVQAMLRPEGATMAELQEISGLKQPKAPWRCWLFGYGFRTSRVGGVTRCFAVAPAGCVMTSGGVLPMPASNLNGLMDYIAAPAAARTYFANRTEALARMA